MSGISVSGLPLLSLPTPRAATVLEALPDVSWTLPAAMLTTGQDGLPAGMPRGVRVRAVGCGLTVPADTPDADRLHRELDRLRCCVEAAADNDVPVVATTTGPAGALTWETALERRGELLAPILRLARDAGVTVTLENTHSIRSDVSFLHTLRDTVAAARALGTSVCADLYCCWAERGLAETLTAGADVIQTVQYADFVHGTLVQPDRRVPGDGDLPLDRLLSDVCGSGFAGTHEIEVLGPWIDAEGLVPSLRRSIDWLRQGLDAR